MNLHTNWDLTENREISREKRTKEQEMRKIVGRSKPDQQGK